MKWAFNRFIEYFRKPIFKKESGGNKPSFEGDTLVGGTIDSSNPTQVNFANGTFDDTTLKFE